MSKTLIKDTTGVYAVQVDESSDQYGNVLRLAPGSIYVYERKATAQEMQDALSVYHAMEKLNDTRAN